MNRAPLLIVIVDDSPEDRATLRRMLLEAEQRYEVIETGTGAAGVAASLGSPERWPDCVILDYYLPDLPAADVLAALRAGGALTICPVLVLTGIAEPQCGPLVLRAGAQDYLDKSWLNPELLVRAIDNAMERHRWIEEAHRREAALRERDEELQLALQASGTGLWTRDFETDTLRGSPEYSRLHGVGEGDAPQSMSEYLELVHEDDRDLVRERYRAAIEGRTPYEGEFRIVRPGGEVAWVASQGKAAYDADGRPRGMLGATRDITRRKLAEIGLFEADRRKDEFLAELAHELRNPLAALRLGVGLLGRDPSELDRARTTAMMERQLGHLVRLVDDLLDVSRISSGRIELTRERVELGRVVDAALELSRPLVDAAGHTLVVSLPEEATHLDGDLARLAQVVSNLISNAAKYTPHGGRIELTADARGSEVQLRVTDNGVGIPREMLARVFDLFAQVAETRPRAQGGLGIGLSLVRKLVEMHGGQVSAESPGPGQGSTFTVRLPLARPRVDDASTEVTDGGAPSPRGSGSGPGPLRRSVLVVDDNEDAADILAQTLRLSGHDALAVYDGHAALDAARATPPDVVFLDLGLPGMDGYEIARRMRAERRLEGVVLIALTGWGGEADRRRTREGGFDHHLIKPPDPASLDDLMTRLLPAQTHEHER